MNTALETLRREVATVKAASPFAKAAPAERALDAVVACFAGIDRRLTQLEERMVNHGSTEETSSETGSEG